VALGPLPPAPDFVVGARGPGPPPSSVLCPYCRRDVLFAWSVLGTRYAPAWSVLLFIGAMRPARGPPSCDRRDAPCAQSAVPLSSARCAPRVVRCSSSLCVGVMRSARSACRFLGAMRSTRGPPGVCLWGRRCCRAGACAWCLVRGRACVVAVLQSRCFDCRGFLVSGSGHGLHFMITILPSRSKHT